MVSYELQAAQMNEKLPWELSLGLTLTQHPRDENFELQEVCLHFESQTPSSLVLSNFFELSYLDYFIVN
jgi:hypothetical protein